MQARPPIRRPTSPARLSAGDRMVILTMFLLPIPTFLGEAAARAADTVRFGTASGRLLLSPQVKCGRHVLLTSALLLAMFGFAMLSMVFGISHTLRDVLDVLRVAAFLIVFHFGASLVRRSSANAAGVTMSCLKLLLSIGALNAAFTAAQYFLPDATRPLQTLFAVSDRHMDLLDEQGRAFGFFLNPNTNAIMLLLLALPSVALFRMTSRPFYLALGGAVLATILLTGSRTGLMLTALAIVVLCVASRRFTYLAALAAVGWGAYESLDYLVRTDIARQWFPYLSELLFKLHGALHGDGFDVTTINSFNSRLVHWERTMDWYFSSPLFGCGPLREELPSFADNYYVYLLSRYGQVGLGLYIAYSLYVAGLSAWAILRRRAPCRDWAMLTLTSVVVVNAANYTLDAFMIVPVGAICLLYSGNMASLMDLSAPARGLPRRSPAIRRRPRAIPKVVAAPKPATTLSACPTA
ncbi:MAG: hypothetical protein AB7G28_10025 [Pirellulales bacterium]